MDACLKRIAYCLTTLLLFGSGTAFSATTVTKLLDSGLPGEKRNLVVIGDGFTAGADQTLFNNYVRDRILNGSFAEGPLWESANAFNIHRINIDSAESGVTQFQIPGCVQVPFNNSYSSSPIAVATKNTHNGGDGGWLRRCDLTSNGIGLIVDEDQDQDGERNHAAENAGIVAFSRSFDAQFTNPNGSTWRMEANTVTLPATAAGSTNFLQINFRQTYTTSPKVFLLASSEGGDPSAIRIRNVTQTGFQAVQVEPPGEDGPHAGMTVHYVAIEPGQHQLPDGRRIEVGSINTNNVQHGGGVPGVESWQTVSFNSPFTTSPAVLAQIQNMQNENNAPPGTPSTPWLTAAVQNVTAASVQLALERSEVDDGTVNSNEQLAYFTMQANAQGSFTDNSSNNIMYESLISQTILTGWNDPIVTVRNTALDYRYSGVWDRCWMEPGPNTTNTLNNILDNFTPGWNYVVVVLNETRGGGCQRGNRIELTLGSGWPTVSHELGHMVGGLADEYCRAGRATGDEPGAVNVTMNTDRNTLKWRDFVNPSTCIPTGVNANPGNGQCTGYNQCVQPPGWSDSDDAGLFEGARYRDSGISRPVVNGRMRGNIPPHSPVGYDAMKNNLDPYHEHTYQNSYVGDFNRDGRDDVVIHNANSLALYQSVGTELEPIWVATGKIPVWDDFKPGDRFYVGDFNSDGRDDLFVFNYQDWAIPYFGMLRSTGSGFEMVRRFDGQLPGWGDMKKSDQFFVADFDGDNYDDLYVFNGDDWSMGYLLMLRSTGNNLTFVSRYDNNLPGWGPMEKHDKFYVADFNADNHDDLYIFNGQDWSIGYLQMLRSTGSQMVHTRRFDGELPGWDDMKQSDQFFVADFDNDNRDDLYIFNGRDWSMEYLQMLRSTGDNMVYTRRYDGTVPGWDGLARNDQFYVADINGDNQDDLYVFNSNDWATEYLGILVSAGSTLGGSWQSDWIGSWNLGSVDRFLVANFNGDAGWDDLFVLNDNWFGLLRSHRSSVQLNAIYPKWIHRHRYHRLGWW